MAENVKITNLKILAKQQAITDDTVMGWIKRPNEEVAREEIVAWLKKTTYENTRLKSESIRTAVLQDLNCMPPGDQNKTDSLSWIAGAKFQFVVIAGALLAICDGFSGIASILNTFTIPAVAVIIISAVFAAVSLAFFYHFDRVEMSKILGEKLKKSYELLYVCVNQVEQIKQIRKGIDHRFAKVTDRDELQALYDIAEMLAIRYGALDDLRKRYTSELKNPYLQAVKLAMAVIEGVFIGASGFFAGQSLALVVAGFFSTAIAVTFWPIPVTGFVLGLAAVGVYCFVDRPGYENRVGYLLGFDQEAIESFAGDDVVIKQKEKLQSLAEKVADKLQARQQIDQTKKTTRSAEDSHVFTVRMMPEISNCRDTLFNHKRSRSLGDIDILIRSEFEPRFG